MIGLFWFFRTELYEWFVYFGNKYLVSHIICKYYFPFCRLSFCSLYGFLCCAKILNLIRSHLFIFVLVSITLGDRSKKLLLWFTSKCVLCMFSSRSLRVSGFVFRPLNHFEFIFVYGIRECSNFTLLHGVVQFFQSQLLTRLSFLHCIVLPPLSWISWPSVHGFIFGHSVPLIYMIAFCASTILFYLYGIIWSQGGLCLRFHFSF